MSFHDIPTDDPIKMIRAIREKIYEEIKEMTPEERIDRTRHHCNDFYNRTGGHPKTSDKNLTAE